MSLEALVTLIPITIVMFSGAWLLLNAPQLPDYPTQDAIDALSEAPQNATVPPMEFYEIDSIKSQFNATGEAVIERYIYNMTNSVCWQFTREFIKYNPEWSELILGIGDAFGKCPHSVAYLRRNATSAYVHDAWGGDTFILEFDEAGNFTMWNRIENGTKIFDTRNADWLSQFNHFHFYENEHQTTMRTIRQDNRLQFIEGEI